MHENNIRIDAERDLLEIKKFIEDYIQKTYVKQIESEMFRCKKKCEQQPTKEIELFNALMPYIPDEKRAICQELIRLLEYEQVVGEVTQLFEGKNMRKIATEQNKFKTLMIKILLYNMMIKLDK